MSAWLVAFVGFIYLYIAGEQVVKDNIPIAIMYFGYALANVGLWFATK